MLGECRRALRERGEHRRAGAQSTTASRPRRCIIRRRSPAGWPAASTATTCCRSAGSRRSSAWTSSSRRWRSSMRRSRLRGRRRRHAARRRSSALADELGVADRVHFLGAVDDERAARAVRRTRWRSLYPPFDEDFGYVTLEAFLARKPVDHRDRRRRAERVRDRRRERRVVRARIRGPSRAAINALARRPAARAARWATPASARARHHLGRRDREAGDWRARTRASGARDGSARPVEPYERS